MNIGEVIFIIIIVALIFGTLDRSCLWALLQGQRGTGAAAEGTSTTREATETRGTQGTGIKSFSF